MAQGFDNSSVYYEFVYEIRKGTKQVYYAAPGLALGGKAPVRLNFPYDVHLVLRDHYSPRYFFIFHNACTLKIRRGKGEGERIFYRSLVYH